MRKIIIINDITKFNFLKKKYKLGKNYIVIFLNRFIADKDEFYLRKKNYFFYDQWLKLEDQKKISNFLKHFLFQWYKNEKNEDLSKYNNFSIAKNFNESISIFSIDFLKQYYSFSNFLKKTDKVYFYADKTYTIDIIKFLQKKIKFKCFFKLTATRPHQCENDFLFENIRNPSFVMKTYISYFFSKKYFFKFKLYFSNLILLIIKFFIIKHCAKSVFYLDSGKIKNFKKILFNNEIKKNTYWVIKPNSIFEIFKINKHINYFLPSLFLREDFNVTNKIKNLLNFLKSKNIKFLPCKNVFINNFSKVFEKQFVSSYFYYLSYYRDLKKIKPKLSIITADNYPDHIISAQASNNLKIKTAFYPHGMTVPGEIQLRKGRESIFDYFFAIGKFDFDMYLKNGINRNKISVIGHQHYENFISYKKNSKKKFNKCLILDLSVGNDDPFFLLKDIQLYRERALLVAKKLNVDVLGIKSREDNKRFGENIKNISFKGDIIPIYYNNDSELKDFFDKIDFIIGPPGTALIESLLSNTPFYSFKCTKTFYKRPSWKNNTILDYIHVSNNIKDLEYNILNKKIFKKNKSIQDFINLKKIQSPKDLYYLAEKQISNL